MQYSQSPDTVVHGPTGHRMHQDTAAVTSEITAQDLNQVNWSLMELLNDQGILPAAFDPATPDTYQRVLQAIKKMIDTRSAAPTVIDRTGLAATALLDRFDVIHKYRVDRTTHPTGGAVNITSGMVQGGIYKLFLNAANAGSFTNSDIELRPNGTSYASQFGCAYINQQNPAASANATARRAGLYGVGADAATNSSFTFDTFNGGEGSESFFEMTLFPNQLGYYKKLLISAGDTAGAMIGSGVWHSSTVAWNTVGLLSWITTSTGSVSPYFVDIYVRRVA
jgi:hypothetical protein